MPRENNRSPAADTIAEAVPKISAVATAPPAGSSGARKKVSEKNLAPSASGSAKSPSPASEPGKLSAKELKEKKKREKAERRQQAKSDTPATPQRPQKLQPPKKEAQGKGKKGVQSTAVHDSGIVKTIYSQQPSKAPAGGREQEAIIGTRDKDLPSLMKELEIEQHEKKKKPVFGINNAHPDVHPAILTLGVQMNQFLVVGSSARCLGFMLAMKRLINDYECPAGATISRHLPGHYFSRQIDYLISARPMSTALGNSIRWLKTEIAAISPELSEEAAKKLLCEKIDVFIRERLTAATEVIVNTTAGRYINNGDTILIYSKSSVIERSLLEAHTRGKRFKVIVADSSHLFEGKNSLATLVAAGIEVQYMKMVLVEQNMASVTRVLLGAHSLQANGSLYSRAGCSMIARSASKNGIPVIVCCESIKFSEKFTSGGIIGNEFGDTDVIAPDNNCNDGGVFEGWRNQPTTSLSSFMFDTTPAKYIKAVISEHGTLGPTNCPNVLRANSSSAPLR
ncbi:nagb/rpia/CoA transferase-like protein [Choiromyces venosus 120613-1]|uniref:Translation initiation factor eIF2B subunit delta n=1 Tax=Choiromyces venosus 120613-1 TaxID=1336337 RepID=A0A3N4JMU8_9PEZI|nr:nagb/rpia/CoA transferase-like protein [Choiromyces venosus 120613-1]